jgi:hypothetical protein
MLTLKIDYNSAYKLPFSLLVEKVRDVTHKQKERLSQQDLQ